MRSDLVLTPGGYRHRSLVHRVERNQGVHITEGKARLTDLTTRTIINYPEVTIKPGDIPGFGSAWVAYAYWANTSGQPITSFRTTWQVPEPPSTDSNQIIYLFSGIDPSDPSTGILQPVLQWGRSEAGGGPYWSVASWYVAGASAGSNAYYTTPVQVNPGDTLVGAMTLTNQSGGTFDYNCEFEGISGTSLPALNHPELVWCNETLEVYNVAQCSDFPNNPNGFTGGTYDISFNEIGLYSYAGAHITPAWSKWVATGLTPSCSYSPTVPRQVLLQD